MASADPRLRRSSRVGSKEYKSPAPLRFASVAGAREHIKKNKLKVTHHETHTRGARIHVVDSKGKPRTISIELPKKESESAE